MLMNGCAVDLFGIAADIHNCFSVGVAFCQERR
jgi:hypothetical protein